LQFCEKNRDDHVVNGLSLKVKNVKISTHSSVALFSLREKKKRPTHTEIPPSKWLQVEREGLTSASTSFGCFAGIRQT
jgi:hypothetical protein